MIHYHGTPMTPDADMATVFAGRHTMVSFEAPQQMELAAEICQSVALDNGAFTAWRNGRPYDFNGYADWAGFWLRHPCVEWCVIPDQIDGSEQDNDDMIAAWRLPRSQSVPVWHMHESVDRLVRLAKAFPRVALGSSGRFAVIGTDQWWVCMSDAMTAVCDSDGFPITKLHGLRMLDPGVFSKIPLASVDSCMVARNVGMDERWRSSVAPKSRRTRAYILIERIERHASAAFWNPDSVRLYQNGDLFG